MGNYLVQKFDKDIQYEGIPNRIFAILDSHIL